MPLNQIDQAAAHGWHAIALITGKLAALNWSDFVTKLAPMFLGMVLVSGGMVKLYGDSRANEILNIVDEKAKSASELSDERFLRIEQMIENKLETVELRMKIYTDEKTQDRFTATDFASRMIMRDAEVKAIGKKQDGVREMLVPSLRTDIERMDSQLQTLLKENSRDGKK